MPGEALNILFLCQHNSARSILAEALLNRLGHGRFHAYSAGAHPLPALHPMTIELLRHSGFDPADFRSKSWDEFTGAEAPQMDYIFTLCDEIAGEVCPIWPASPVTLHWGITDPAHPALPVTEQKALFEKVFRELDQRLILLASLPDDSLHAHSMQTLVSNTSRA